MPAACAMVFGPDVAKLGQGCRKSGKDGSKLGDMVRSWDKLAPSWANIASKLVCLRLAIRKDRFDWKIWDAILKPMPPETKK